MTKKHMKMYSTSLVINGMQIKTTVSYYYTLTRMCSVKSLSESNIDEDLEQLEL